MHDLATWSELRAVTRRPVVEAGAKRDEAVTLVHRPRAGKVPVHALHAQEAGRVGRDARDAHERAPYGRTDLLREVDDLLRRTGPDGPAAEVHERPARPVYRCGSCLKLISGRTGRLVGGKRLRILPVDHRTLDVGGNVHEDGPPPARVRKSERLAQHLLQAVRVAHEVVVLRDWQRDARDVKLLERIRSDHLVRHVARNGNQRYGVQVRRGNARHQVRRARTGGRDHDARLSSRPSVAVRRVAAMLLVRRLDDPNLVRRIVESVEQLEHGPARIAKHGVDTLGDEGLDNALCARDSPHTTFLRSSAASESCG